MRRTRLIVAVLVSAIAAVIALGLPLGERPRVFEQVATARSPLQKVLIYLGREVSDYASKYPASLFAIFDVGCSATLVGSDALLTSEHCVTVIATAQADVTLRINGVDRTATCTASSSADIALCQLDTPVDGITFDVIERNATMAAVDGRIRLTGWADPPPVGFIDRFWWRIRRRLGWGAAFKEGTGTITVSNALLTVTGDATTSGFNVLEPGDSGGAGYAEENSKRTIIGVNKCGGAFCGTGATAATSRLVNVTDSSVAEWIQGWANDNGASVCGFTTTVGCRP